VTSALEVIFNVMRSINPRFTYFTYLLTYLLTYRQPHVLVMILTQNTSDEDNNPKAITNQLRRRVEKIRWVEGHLQ